MGPRRAVRGVDGRAARRARAQLRRGSLHPAGRAHPGREAPLRRLPGAPDAALHLRPRRVLAPVAVLALPPPPAVAAGDGGHRAGDLPRRPAVDDGRRRARRAGAVLLRVAPAVWVARDTERAHGAVRGAGHARHGVPRRAAGGGGGRAGVRRLAARQAPLAPLRPRRGPRRARGARSATPTGPVPAGGACRGRGGLGRAARGQPRRLHGAGPPAGVAHLGEGRLRPPLAHVRPPHRRGRAGRAHRDRLEPLGAPDGLPVERPLEHGPRAARGRRPRRAHAPPPRRRGHAAPPSRARPRAVGRRPLRLLGLRVGAGVGPLLRAVPRAAVAARGGRAGRGMGGAGPRAPPRARRPRARARRVRRARRHRAPHRRRLARPRPRDRRRAPPALHLRSAPRVPGRGGAGVRHHRPPQRVRRLQRGRARPARPPRSLQADGRRRDRVPAAIAGRAHRGRRLFLLVRRRPAAPVRRRRGSGPGRLLLPGRPSPPGRGGLVRTDRSGAGARGRRGACGCTRAPVPTRGRRDKGARGSGSVGTSGPRRRRLPDHSTGPRR